MFSVSPEIWNVLSLAARWLFVFFALMLLLFAFSWHHSDRKERRDRFKNLPGAGTVGEFIVLSGSDQLPLNTWFPVPREGVLGSLRSCDLVVPCPGVHSQHLDFSWQDGTGLLVRPRIGCEVLVDGVPVSRRGEYADTPLQHGSLLQVGNAVLRLQVFSALSNTNRIFTQPSPVPAPGTGAWMPPVQPPAAVPPAQAFPASPQPEQPPFPDYVPIPPAVAGQSSQPDQPQQAPAPRRRRTGSWKEDWSE